MKQTVHPSPIIGFSLTSPRLASYQETALEFLDVHLLSRPRRFVQL